MQNPFFAFHSIGMYITAAQLQAAKGAESIGLFLTIEMRLLSWRAGANPARPATQVEASANGLLGRWRNWQTR
jgi:hypothetical protein